MSDMWELTKCSWGGYYGYMTNEEKAKKIEEIYSGAIEKIKKLEEERNKVISNYIKELEQQKIDAIRASMDL